LKACQEQLAQSQMLVTTAAPTGVAWFVLYTYVYLQCGLMHRYLTTRRRNQRQKAHADQISATNNTRHARNHGRKHTGEAGGGSMSPGHCPCTSQSQSDPPPIPFCETFIRPYRGHTKPTEEHNIVGNSIVVQNCGHVAITARRYVVRTGRHTGGPDERCA